MTGAPVISVFGTFDRNNFVGFSIILGHGCQARSIASRLKIVDGG